MVSGYLQLRQGLVPGQPLVVAVGSGRGVVRKEGPLLLGPFVLPSWGGLPFLITPGWGGNFPPPPRLHGRSESRSYRTMSPISPDGGDPFGSPWPSSPAPRKASEPASPLGEHPLDLRVGELGNRSASLSLPSHVNGMEA